MIELKFVVKFVYAAGAFAYHITSACDFRSLLRMCDMHIIMMCNNIKWMCNYGPCMHAARTVSDVMVMSFIYLIYLI